MEITFSPAQFASRSIAIIRSPKKFFAHEKHETGWKDAFVFSIALAIISSLLGILQITILFPLFKSFLPSFFETDALPNLIEVLPAFFVSTVLVVALSFVWSGALYLWAKVWKIKGNYWQMYRVYTYSRAPLSLLGWIPYIGGFFGLYTFYVLALGVSSQFSISLKKSLLFLIGPFLLLFIIQVFLFALSSSFGA